MKQLISLLLVGALAATAGAQAFPNKPVKVIVPSAPGDGSDILARAIGQKLTERWGQPVLVENRPGAGGVVGTEAAARSAADGYTVIMGNAGSHAINQALYPKLSYDVVRDFAPITLVASAPNVFVVNPSVPAKRWLSSSRWRRKSRANIRSRPAALALRHTSMAKCSRRSRAST